MNHIFPSALLIAALAIPASADELIVPNNAPTTAGTGGYSTLLHSMPRSYQLVVGPEELTALPPGSLITGITWRRPTWQSFADWPGTGFTCAWTNYDIYLSSSENVPGALSTTYTDNLGADFTLCRGGPISMSGPFFPGGALSPQVNAFGTLIPFSNAYLYQGGELLLTVRHDGNNCGGNGSLETVPSPFTQALGVSSYTQSDNWYNQGLIVMKLEFTPPAGLGTPTCSPAANNSTGSPAILTAGGLITAQPYTLFLNTTNLPPNQFGYYVAGPTQAFIPTPNFSQGNLCVGNPQFRIIPSLQNTSTGVAGQAAWTVDTNNVDSQGASPSADANQVISPGETFHFQLWYRDLNPTTTSNFSNGLSVLFQ